MHHMDLMDILNLATSFAQREAKTRIGHRDWLKLAGEKIRREQVGTVPSILFAGANKFAKWKTAFTIVNNKVARKVSENAVFFDRHRFFSTWLNLGTRLFTRTT